jgi:hypothetical protein
MVDWDKHEESDPGAFDRLNMQEKRVLAHEAVGWLDGEREYIWDYLAQLKGLVTLEVDMTNAYCPVGCCRSLDIDVAMLLSAEPECVRISGVSNESEGKELLERVGGDVDLGSEELKAVYGIEINPSVDKWEMWKGEGEGQEEVVEKRIETIGR